MTKKKEKKKMSEKTLRDEQIKIITDDIKNVCDLVNIILKHQEWFAELKERYDYFRFEAFANINQEMYRFYWSIGQDIADFETEENIGEDFYHAISNHLSDILNSKLIFSSDNLKCMRKLHGLFPDGLIEIEKTIKYIPWDHIKFIIDRFESNKNKVIFYLNKTLEKQWGFQSLKENIDNGLYENEISKEMCIN